MVVSCPDLCCPDENPRDPEDFATARLFEQVIAVVTGFCPKVEVVEPGVCAFGARGPARYFGGETALAAKIIAAVADLGVESRVGIADGLFTALLAARAPSPPPARPSPRQPAARRPARDARPILVIPPGETASFLAAQPVSVLADQRPGRAAEAARPGHARGFRRAARPRRGQQVRRRGGVRAPAGPRPGLPAAGGVPAACGPVRGPGVRPARTAGRTGGVRGQGARRTAARRPRRPRADLCPRAGSGHLGGRAGKQQAVAARRAAVRGRSRRPGPLATRRLAPCSR